MGPELFRSSLSGRRRGSHRAAALFTVLALATIFAAGCGDDAVTDSEKAHDLEALDVALTQELTAVRAYAHGLPLLRGQLRPVGREFRAQAQEHVSAITKAIRGLGGEVEAEAEELDYPALQSQADFLTLAYNLENAALAIYLDASPRLETYAPRRLVVSLAASHAQHLVLLREAFGASPVASAPEAFEPGDLPPPPVPTSAGAALETPAG